MCHITTVSPHIRCEIFTEKPLKNSRSMPCTSNWDRKKLHSTRYTIEYETANRMEICTIKSKEQCQLCVFFCSVLLRQSPNSFCCCSEITFFLALVFCTLDVPHIFVALYTHYYCYFSVVSFVWRSYFSSFDYVSWRSNVSVAVCVYLFLLPIKNDFNSVMQFTFAKTKSYFSFRSFRF